MRAAIFIHVGLHKTGTTSIQATLFHNRATLLANGINYLDTHQNHSRIINPVFGTAPDRYRPKDTASLQAQLQRALRANVSPSLVISGEDISALGKDEIARMRDGLAPYAGRFRIIAYVRDPYASINSRAQARLRRGETFEQIVARPPRTHYRRIGPFIDIFGRDNVDIRIFDHDRFVGGGLIADFMAALGANPALTSKIDIIRTKQALSHEASCLLNEINRRYPVDAEGEHRGRAPNIHALLRRIPGQTFRAPHAVFTRRVAETIDELQWLHALLGKEVFPEQPPDDDQPLRWNEETLGAIAALINDLAVGAAGTRRGLMARLQLLLGREAS
jgi:hypothetical protein